jgi:hypothetical protein
MLLWILQIAVLSILLIALIHHLIQFFTDMLTVQKVREYKQITTKPQPQLQPQSSELPQSEDMDSMKNELKLFLQSQLHH